MLAERIGWQGLLPPPSAIGLIPTK